MQQFKPNPEKYGNPIIVHETELFEQEARIAVALVERWGIIAALPDGEDSSGRQALRLHTPEELVTRAFDTAKLAVEEARKRELILVIPDVAELFPDKAKAA